MAKINPFKAVRSTPDKVQYVTTKSFENYNSEELQAVLANNPFSFLHILHPEYPNTKSFPKEERYSMIRKRYEEFKKNNILQQEHNAYFYLYQIRNNSSTHCGIIAAASTDDYGLERIKKHEETIDAREKLFANYLKNVGFNADPVLLTYPDNAIINAITEKYLSTIPEYDFTTPTNEHHKLWLIANNRDIEQLQNAFNTISTLYIADGHHRCASSYVLAKLLQKENPKHTVDKAYNYFMSYLIPESSLKIFEFNRLIKDLNGHSPAAFIQKLEQQYEVHNFGNNYKHASAKHEFSMYLDGNFYQLRLKKNSYNFADALSKLDTHLLFATILKPFLGITDARKDDRILYFYGKDAILKSKIQIDNNTFKVSFGMSPITIEELKNIADEGLKMPPKSTYILPKLRSALLLYEF